MSPLELAGLTALMERTWGRPEVVVGLVDGPIAMNHPDLTGDTIREVPGKMSGSCTQTNSAACLHGTFWRESSCAKRGSPAPAICPNCTLLAYPIFAETPPDNTEMPSATPEDLAAAILACIEAGARILNLSLGLTQSVAKGERALGEALDHAARRGVIIVAAAGNQGSIGGTVITRHPWVIPVAACDYAERPDARVESGPFYWAARFAGAGRPDYQPRRRRQPLTLGGTSVAAPFVTGAIALLWSEFPAATAAK